MYYFSGYIEVKRGRLMAPFGGMDRDAHSGCAAISPGQWNEEVTAVGLELTEAVAFFRDILGPRVQRTRVGAWIVRQIKQVDIDRPENAARDRPVFEHSPLQPQC